MSECNHDCSACQNRCDTPESLMAPANAFTHVKHVIGIVSGKGGVGKSLVTGLMASAMQKRGQQAAILDADITGPSIPRMFGTTDRAEGNESGIFPLESKGGVRMISVNNLLESDTDPVVWRGSLISNAVKQFWTDVLWGDVDFMFVDMPPGTGDVPLTVFQSLPVSGIIIVTSPQELVSMIVQKAINMARMMDIPVLGVVENMSYATCPCCSERIYPFGKGRTEEVCMAHHIPLLARLPIDPAIAEKCDHGCVEEVDVTALDAACRTLEALA